jgi:cellulose synthase (UDP-forming)
MDASLSDIPHLQPPAARRVARGARAVRSEPALSARRRVVHALLGALWLVVLVRFCAYWARGEHRGDPALFIPATLAMAYLVAGLPTFFWFYVGRMRRPVHMPAPAGLRVAVITLCVPSHESLDIIERQLRALARIRYPHDSWVLDEGADPRVRRLAAATGVRYFTRKGVARWNRPGPPFQARTKAGNVNAWLDAVADAGEDYDVFVQLDVDHHPRPEYLDRTLGFFADPDVAWVQAPSVSHNLESWTARGLAEQDVILQGPLQMGFYGYSGTPFIIGSHTTYRTASIRAIGGFQPTRAEDHLDTVVLAAAGHTGVYLPEVIADGDGPEDLGTYLGQQFAWAYSMVQILLTRTPRLVRRYTRRQGVQFVVAQSWYTFWSLAVGVLWALPIVALLTDRPITTMAVGEFLAYYLATLATSTLMWWSARHWFQPPGLRLSWRGMVLEVARWPIVLWAVVNVLLGVKRPYMITRKGTSARAIPSGLRLYGPFFALAATGVGAVLAFRLAVGHGDAQGHIGLVLLDTLLVVALLVTAVGLELRALEERLGGRVAALRARAGVVASMALLCAATAVACAAAWAPLLEALR